MTPQELKNSIFQLAIQGKLVEQRPEEGTAEELYQQIQAEKQKLIKEGKIKKEKPLPEITEDEKPFEIPERWKWVRLLSLCSSITDIDHNMPKAVPNGYPLLSAKDINDDLTLNFQNEVKQISYEDYIRMGQKSKPDVGDIIFSRIGTLGKVGIVSEAHEFLVSYSCCTIKRIGVNNRYLSYCLLGPEMQSRIVKAKTGIGVPDLGIKMIKEFLIPLPPLAEQKRIVAKIEELLPLIDRYEKAWSRLEEFNKRFPDDMQKSILQMAIQGKLVDQQPEEGTAEELYIDIIKKKTKIESAGILKGRKKKELKLINDNDIPFDIPFSWKWIRLGEVSEIFGRIGFRGYTKNDIVDKGKGAITISPSNLLPNGHTDFSECTYISWEKYEESPEIQIYENDILIVKTGSSYGKCCIVKSLPEKATINPQLAVLKYILCDYNFLVYALSSPMAREQYEAFVIGTSIPTFSQEKLSNLIIPLPPLAEQKRIIARIEELLFLCEKLKSTSN